MRGLADIKSSKGFCNARWHEDLKCSWSETSSQVEQTWTQAYKQGERGTKKLPFFLVMSRTGCEALLQVRRIAFMWENPRDGQHSWPKENVQLCAWTIPDHTITCGDNLILGAKCTIKNGFCIRVMKSLNQSQLSKPTLTRQKELLRKTHLCEAKCCLQRKINRHQKITFHPQKVTRNRAHRVETAFHKPSANFYLTSLREIQPNRRDCRALKPDSTQVAIPEQIQQSWHLTDWKNEAKWERIEYLWCMDQGMTQGRTGSWRNGELNCQVKLVWYWAGKILNLGLWTFYLSINHNCLAHKRRFACRVKPVSCRSGPN